MFIFSIFLAFVIVLGAFFVYIAATRSFIRCIALIITAITVILELNIASRLFTEEFSTKTETQTEVTEITSITSEYKEYSVGPSHLHQKNYSLVLVFQGIDENGNQYLDTLPADSTTIHEIKENDVDQHMRIETSYDVFVERKPQQIDYYSFRYDVYIPDGYEIE